MWLFTPDGFFSAVQHKDDPNKIMIRTRAELHAQNLVDACPADAKPEMVETPPPADYRYRVTVSREIWIYLVAKFAADISYVNFKNEAGKRPQPKGFIGALHAVWGKLLDFQDSMHDDTQKTRWGSISHGVGSDPFSDLDGWLSRNPSRNRSASDLADVVVDEYVEVVEGMIVQMADDEAMGEGEVLSVDEECGTALVHFIQYLEGSETEEDVIKVSISDLLVVCDPLPEESLERDDDFDEDDFDDVSAWMHGSKVDPVDEDEDHIPSDTHTSLDDYEDDGSWPSPKASGWFRGR